MTPRRPSPQLCQGCYRPHVRLDRVTRARRRQALITAVEWDDPVSRLYAIELFDHLTIGLKVEDLGAPGQIHPAPPTPRTWTAGELAHMDRLVLAHTFGVAA